MKNKLGIVVEAVGMFLMIPGAILCCPGLFVMWVAEEYLREHKPEPLDEEDDTECYECGRPYETQKN